MLRIVNIGGKEIDLLANAATPIRYKMVFGEDIMVAFNQINGKKRDEGEILDISSIKVDDLSLAEKDLVKFVGREYVAHDVVAPKAFAKIVK